MDTRGEYCRQKKQQVQSLWGRRGLGTVTEQQDQQGLNPVQEGCPGQVKVVDPVG